MQKFNKRYVLIGFIVLSIAFSFYFLAGRYRAESQYKKYDVAADYNQFLKMAYENGTEPIEYFRELKENGVNKISIVESSINSMSMLPGSKLKTEVSEDNLIVKGRKDELDFIERGLQTLKHKRQLTRLSDEELIVEGRVEDLVTHRAGAYDFDQNRVGEVGLKSSILEYIGLGFDTNVIENLKSAGIDVVLRPTFYSKAQDAEQTMKRFMDYVENYNPTQNWIVFSGTEFYSNGLEDSQVNEEFMNWLKERNISLAVVEASTQRGHTILKGVDPVIKNDSVAKARAFTTWDYLQDRYDYQIPLHRNGEELTNVYYRAISERNIAIIFIAPYAKNNDTITDPEMYGNVLKSLETRMAQKGYTSGDVSPMGEWNPNPVFKIPVALGVVASGLILLELIFNVPNLLLIVVGILGALASVLFFGLGKMQTMGNILFNLAAIVIYPSLAVGMITKSYKIALKNKDTSLFKIYIHGMAILLVAVVITLIGALNEISFLSGTNYLVELVEFRGVKISQILPILVTCLIYMTYVGYNRDEKEKSKLRVTELNDLMLSDVKIWQAALGVLFVAVVGIFLLRGGNTNTKVPGMELFARNIMEIYLPVRPRTKAILMGWPAVVILIYIAYKKESKAMAFPLLLLTAIGMADIVNTFSHIRTPLYISFTRIIVEFFVAAIVSIIFLIALEILRKGYDKLIGK